MRSPQSVKRSILGLLLLLAACGEGGGGGGGRKAPDASSAVPQVLGVVGQGQSLRLGGKGTDTPGGVSTAVYPEAALMLAGGPVGKGDRLLAPEVVALREGATSSDVQTWTPRVTTFSSAARHVLTPDRLARRFKFVASGQAMGGASYEDLRKNSPSGLHVYENTLEQIRCLASKVAGYKVRAMELIHGESDGLNNNCSYDIDIAQWRADLDADVKAITGQEEDVLAFYCQTSSICGARCVGGATEDTFPTPVLQLKAHEADPARMILIGPRYWLPYYDQMHLTNTGQRTLGEKYGEAYDVLLNGGSWLPLKPTSFAIIDDAIVIDFHVPYGELTFDTTNVRPVADYGFSFHDDAGRTISEVLKTGPGQITIRLSGSPGANAVVGYAYHNGLAGAANQAVGLGERGNLRDQDPVQSAYDDSTIPLYNWCVTFRKELN